MCRCAERRTVIVDAVAAVARGELGAAVPAATSVAVTTAQDMVMAARRLAAHARLRR